MIKNNRYRHTGVKIKDYIHRNWKIMLLLVGLCFFVSLLLVSTIGQKILIGIKAIPTTPGQFINPIYIIYYGIGKFGLYTFALGVGLSIGIIKYKIYIDEMDRMYDPRPNCDFMISPTGVYGTNRIADKQEIEQFETSTSISKTNKIVIGKNDDGTVQVLLDSYKGKPIGIGPHKFVSGATGSWKTSSVFIPDIMQLMLQGISIICTDPKGELRLKLTKLAQKLGYTTKELNTINPFLSDGMDILKLIETYADARTLTDIIMQNTEDSAIHKEDFWAKGERAAICFAILYVLEAKEYEGKRHFSQAYNFIRSTPVAEINDRVELLPESSAAKKQWEIFQTTPENSQGGIITGVATRLAILNDDVIAKIVDTDEIDIVAPGKEKCIYFVIVSDNDPSNNLIAAMFFSLTFNRLIKEADSHLNQKLLVPVMFEFDEMMNIGKIPNFPKMLSVIRSRDMRCTICTQDIGQMQDAYPGKLWTNILGNCDTKVMLGVNDSEVSAPYWSRCSGIMTIISESTRERKDRYRVYTRNDEVMLNEGVGKREVFTPGEIMSLPNEYQLVFFRGHNVQMIKKFSYFEHPLYKEIEEELYTEHEPKWWTDVLKGMETAKNIDEYKWFAIGMKKLKTFKDVIEKEREIERKKEEAIARKTETIRDYNSGEIEFKNLSPSDKIMIIRNILLEKYAKLYNSLHNVTKDQNIELDESAAPQESYTEEDNFENYDSHYEERINSEDAYLDDSTVIGVYEDDYYVDEALEDEEVSNEPDFNEPDFDDFEEPNFNEPTFDIDETEDQDDYSEVPNEKLLNNIHTHFEDRNPPKKSKREKNNWRRESLMDNVDAIKNSEEANSKRYVTTYYNNSNHPIETKSCMNDIMDTIKKGEEEKVKKQNNIKNNMQKGMKGI